MENEEMKKLLNSHFEKDEIPSSDSKSGNTENHDHKTNQNSNVGITESSLHKVNANQQVKIETPSTSDKPNHNEVEELTDKLGKLTIKVTSEVESDSKNQDNSFVVINLDDDDNNNENEDNKSEAKIESDKQNENKNLQNNLNEIEKEDLHNNQNENENSEPTKQILKKPKAVKPRKILRRMPKAPEKNAPIEHEVYLSLEEAKNGCTKTIEIERIFQGYGDRKICDKKEFPLSIAPGIDKEFRITVEGEGNKSLLDGKLQGDVIFIVRPTFKQINQYDIEYTARLSSPPNEDGIYVIEIPTLEKVLIKLEMKADLITEETIEKLTGRGLPFPKYEDGKTHGDLLVRFEILHPIKPKSEINNKQNGQSSSGQVKQIELKLTLHEIFKGCTRQMEISRKRIDSDGVEYDDEKIFKIEIKPGTKGGSEILFPKEGDQLDDVTFVDIAFVVTDIPNETFERKGLDVIYNAKISNKQLEIEIPTLEGEMKKIQLDENIAQKLEKRFHGKGLPYPGDTRSRGSLYVKFKIVGDKEALEFKIKMEKEMKEKIEKKPVISKNQTNSPKLEIPNQLPPNHYPLELTIEEIYYGCVKQEKITRKTIRGNVEHANEVTVDVQVNPGSTKGTKITLNQAGDQKFKMISADVIFTVAVKEHSIFKIENSDLIYYAIITSDEALVGCNLKIPTIVHDIFELQVEGQITASTERLIPGLGMPLLNNDKGEHGNLLVRFNILSNAVKQDPPIKLDLPISLEQIFTGTTKKRKLQKQVIDSNGKSKVETKILSIFIKPGTEAGSKIIFPRESDQYHGSVPADIIFITRDMPHSLFTRNRANIEYNVKVTQNQLNLGKMFEIPLLECNENVSCFVDNSIKENPERHFKDRGLPFQENPECRGDLVVRFEIIQEIKKKDKDIRADLNLTLENILHGFEKQVKINRKVVSESGEEIFYDEYVKIYVEPGTVAGTEYPQECLGDQRPGIIPADIVFVARDKPHPYFKRDGADIRYITYVTHKEAYDWVKLEIPTLDEKKTLVWEPKWLYGYVLNKKFSGHGLPGKNGDPKKRGDLIASYEIVHNDLKVPIIKLDVPLTLEETLIGGVKRVKFNRIIIDQNGDRKEKEIIVTFDIERGSQIGKGPYFPRIGNQQPGYSPGDLWIVFSEQPHDIFKRIGANLQYTVKTTVSKAAQTKFIQVPTLEKCYVSIKVDKITKNSSYELPGRGLPFYGYSYQRGKIIVKFEITEDIIIEMPQVNHDNVVEKIDENITKTTEKTTIDKVDPMYVDLELTLDEVFLGGNKAVSFERKFLDENGNVDYKTVNFSLQLKRGIEVGNEIILKEKGDVYFGKQPADLIYVVKDVKYDHFTRNGANLEYTANITYDESVNGCMLQIPTLIKDSNVDLTIDQQVNEKSVEIIRRRGLPFLDNPTKFGDIIVNFKIVDKTIPDIKIQNQNLSRIHSEEIKLDVTLEEIHTGTARKEHLKINKFRPDGKQVIINRNVTVKIKPGTFSGEKIVLPKEGSQRSKDSEAEDLVFVIQEKPHTLFTRDGANIEYIANVNSSQIRPGSQISIPTLDNENHLLSINESFNIETEIPIKGHGLPFYDEPDKRGDLMVRFKLNNEDFKSTKTEKVTKDLKQDQKKYALSLTLLEVLKGCVKNETIERIFFDSSGNKQTENKTFAIKIKPGTKTGHEFEFKQQGNQFSATEEPSDVVFVVRDKPHDFFKRDGVDILYTETINKEQAERALKGFKVTIPTLENNNSAPKLKSKKKFDLNKTYTIENQGLPYADKPNKRGKILVTFKIANDSSVTSDFTPKF